MATDGRESLLALMYPGRASAAIVFETRVRVYKLVPEACDGETDDQEKISSKISIRSTPRFPREPTDIDGSVKFSARELSNMPCTEVRI